MDSVSLPNWVHVRLGDRADVLGALLYGSRALGEAGPDSDIDLLLIVAGERAPGPEVWQGPDGGQADVHFTTLTGWREMPERRGWWTFGYANGRPVYDPGGVVERGLEALRVPPPSHRAAGRDLLDGYLNATYRGVKAWRRGDELGARLQATLGLSYLLDGLFRLAGTWTPYWDRLEGYWERLAPLGLDVGALRAEVEAVARTPDAAAQLALYRRVSRWMRAHDLGSILDAWNGQFHNTLRR